MERWVGGWVGGWDVRFTHPSFDAPGDVVDVACFWWVEEG